MKKKLSMFQIILLAVFGSLAVAGILIFALATAGSTGGGVGAVTIWGTLDATAMQTIIRNAAETDPRLAQVTYVQKDPATYQSDLASALASGTGPDIFIITQDYAMRDSSMALTIPYTSISQSQFENTFVQGASPFMGKSGVVAIPVLADPLVMFWNRDMVASAGFAQPVRFWDELQGQAEKITQIDQSGNIKKATIDFGEYQNVDNAKAVLSTLILQAGGKITSHDSSGKLIPALAAHAGSTNQPTESALKFYTEFADPSQPYYTWSQAMPDARQAFAAQQLAYYIGYASEEPLIKQINPNLNYAVTGMPQIRNANASIDYAKVYGLAVSKQSRNQSGALTVAFLLASSNVSNELSLAYGIPSARLDVLAQPAQGNGTLYNKMAIISRSWVDPDPAQTGPLFEAMINNTTSGAMSAQDAVLLGDQTMNHIIGS